MTAPGREPYPSMLAAAEFVELSSVIAPSAADSHDLLAALERARLDIDFLGQLLDKELYVAVAGVNEGGRMG